MTNDRSPTTPSQINWNAVFFWGGVICSLLSLPLMIAKEVRDHQSCRSGTVLVNVPHGRACVPGEYLR